MGKIKDLTGYKFGELTVISFEKGRSRSHWKCLCSCGVVCTKRGDLLTGGKVSCCGCLVEIKAKEKCTTHGMSYSKEYKTWMSIKSRCYNVNDRKYCQYGGRGITFDYPDDFVGFLAEVGSCPLDNLRVSIDRIDNTKGYVKGNMRWATDVQQARNRGKMKNNTSGKTGVSVRVQYGIKYFVAHWSDADGKHTKSFSSKKYGELEAFNLACEYRDTMMSILNEKGFGYGEKHGL